MNGTEKAYESAFSFTSKEMEMPRDFVLQRSQQGAPNVERTVLFPFDTTSFMRAQKAIYRSFGKTATTV